MRINSPTIGSFSSEGSGESSDGYFSEVFETGTEEVRATIDVLTLCVLCWCFPSLIQLHCYM